MTGAGIELSIACPDDLERVRQFYRGLCDSATYSRFFGIRRTLPEDELLRVVTPDLPSWMTVLASIGTDLIGIGQFVPGNAPDEVEVAFAVADDHHHEGAATLLLERLAVIAKRCGFHFLTALTLPDNTEMRLVFHTVGLPEHSRFDDEDGVVHVRLDLAGIDTMHASSAARRAGTDLRCSPT